VPLGPFLESLALEPPRRVAGTAVFMTSDSRPVPPALPHSLKHNKVLHERVAFLTIVTHDVPVVPRRERIQLERLMEGFFRIEAWYGFTERPDVAEILADCRTYGVTFEMMETSFFLSRENVIPGRRAPRLLFWRAPLFAWMSRNATRATDFFNIPPNRVVELGTHLEI
jgi:KUP system potassium uptake protein